MAVRGWCTARGRIAGRVVNWNPLGIHPPRWAIRQDLGVGDGVGKECFEVLGLGPCSLGIRARALIRPVDSSVSVAGREISPMIRRVSLATISVTASSLSTPGTTNHESGSG